MRPMYRPEGCCAVHSGELQQEVWKLLCAWAGLLLSVEKPCGSQNCSLKFAQHHVFSAGELDE